MKHIYVAGPFRAKTARQVELNIREAEQLGLMIAQWGGVPVIPHTMYRFFDGTAPDWLAITASLLRRCDAIALRENYLESVGSVGEEDIATEMKLSRFYLPDDLQALKQWLEDNHDRR